MFVALSFKLKFKYCSIALISSCLKLQKNKTYNRHSVILVGQMSYATKVQTECHKSCDSTIFETCSTLKYIIFWLKQQHAFLKISLLLKSNLNLELCCTLATVAKCWALCNILVLFSCFGGPTKNCVSRNLCFSYKYFWPRSSLINSSSALPY